MEPGQGKHILDTLLHDLYEVPISGVYDNIATIVHDNIELTLNIANDPAVRYVRFNGEIYFSANLASYKDRQSILYDQEITNRNMVMHDDIKDQLIPEIAELKALGDEQKECAHYLRLILNLCNSLHDVEALLPEAGWALLNLKLADWPNETLNFNTDDIERLRVFHHESAEIMKERIFLNLLLRKL